MNLMDQETVGPADRKLYLEFHGRVIEHLGIQMYQSPVNAIAELVANAWDADATVGRNRRGDEAEEKTTDGRPVLGRKGIGKFAGFGIARAHYLG